MDSQDGRKRNADSLGRHHVVMIVQDIYLPEYDWHCRVYYAVTGYWADEILSELKDLGCSGAKYKRAVRNLRSGHLDTGLTYSNQSFRESVIVIGLTSSPEEFAHSFDHEKGHLAKHIASAFGIDPFGEDLQYLSGDIAKKMFPVAKKFMCECCRKKLRPL